MSVDTISEVSETVRRADALSRRKRAARRISTSRWITYVVLLLVMLVFLFPLAFLLNTALKSPAEFNANPVGLVAHVDLGNFVVAWNRGNFGAYILNSVLYTACAAGLGTFMSIMLAYPVARGFLRGSGIWTVVFTLLLFLPNALLTQFQLLLRLDLYNTRLGYILIMAVGVGVAPLLLRGFVSSIPTELDEAAAIDGIGYWRFLFTFVIPLTRPALATVFILQAIWVWNEIILASVLLPDQTLSPVSFGLLTFQGEETNQWSLLAAATLIVAIPLLAAYVFLQRFLVAGVAGGAVKG